MPRWSIVPLDERREVIAAEREHEAGLCAELADADRERALQSLRDCGCAIFQRAGQDEEGIRAAHFREDGTRLGACRRGVKERAACAFRAGEAERARERMAHERLRDLRAGAVQQRECAIGNMACFHRAIDGARDDFRGAGMRRVRLHHDGAARRESRGRVAARGGKGEGEIARAEDDDRAERNEMTADVGARHGLAIG
jgi:hypothetical protein